MYPETATETEKLLKIIESNRPIDTAVVNELIQGHDKKDMLLGEAYYYNDNDIRKRQFYYWKDGQRVLDIEKVNHRIPHGWHKFLVDQKASYLVGKPVTFTCEDEEYLAKLNEVLNDEFDDVLPELAVAASNKGREWLHPYINEDGLFDYIQIPAEEGIPIYGGPKRKNLEAFIRYYSLDEETVKVEVWDKQKVTYYEKIGIGELVLDVTEPINPAPHFMYGEQGYGWGEVPFIDFKNNNKAISDLTFYKELIDSYDRIASDVDNNLEEIQSLIYVLKGYEGQGLEEFMENLKRYKAIATDEDGGVDTIHAEVPIDTVEARLKRVSDDIIKFGQGVDNNPEKFGNAPSGIALQNLYSLLDMKANVLERKFAKAISWLVWFATEFINISEGKDYDYKTVKPVFNKSMITNQVENVTMAMQSKGIVSDETILSNHPWVTDAQEEMERLEKQKEEMMDMYDLPKVGGVNEEPTRPGQNTGQTGEESRNEN